MCDFNENNYSKELRIISIEKANKNGLLLMIPVFILFTGLFVLFHGNPLPVLSEAKLNFINIAFVILIIIAGIVLHELIHGITWSIFAKKGFKSIRFGVLWKFLTPYCHCKEPLRIIHYLLGAITPSIFLGFVPAIWGVITGSFPVVAFGMFFIVAAVGDFMIIHLLIKEDMNDYVQDHPSEAGCFIFRKK